MGIERRQYINTQAEQLIIISIVSFIYSLIKKKCIYYRLISTNYYTNLSK